SIPSLSSSPLGVFFLGVLGFLAFISSPVRAAEAVPSFRNNVQPILAAAGCSSGACHGAAAGKNGFKLSLRGYDDEGDWRAVTRRVKYTAGDTTVCTVDDAGQLKVAGHGEGPVTAWYLSRIAAATVTSPFEGNASDAFSAAKKRNFIDELVLEKLKSLNLPP